MMDFWKDLIDQWQILSAPMVPQWVLIAAIGVPVVLALASRSICVLVASLCLGAFAAVAFATAGLQSWLAWLALLSVAPWIINGFATTRRGSELRKLKRALAEAQSEIAAVKSLQERQLLGNLRART